MKPDHKLTYITMYPDAIKPARAQWPHAIACLVAFAAIGVLLAWRG